MAHAIATGEVVGQIARALISTGSVRPPQCRHRGDISVHQQVAKTLLAHLESGDKIKVQADGTPKVGAFTSKTVKQAEGFFKDVKVNGVPAVTTDQLAAVIDWVEATSHDRRDGPGMAGVGEIPDEDTLGEKVQWHRTEVAQLDKVLALGDQVEVERSWFHQNKLPVPDWNNLDEIRRYAELVEAAAAADEAVARPPPSRHSSTILRRGSAAKLAAVIGELFDAGRIATSTDCNAATSRLEHLHHVAQAVSERDRVRAALDQVCSASSRGNRRDPAAPSGTTDFLATRTRGVGR